MKTLPAILASVSPITEIWQLVAGLEAIAIIILLVGWLTASRLKEPIRHQTSEEES